MRNVKKTFFKVFSSILIVAALLTAVLLQLIVNSSGNERYFSGDAELYYQSLLDAGFPSDYATSLTELHLLHPNWNFVPLKITERKSAYTWHYVIEQETTDPKTNLIPASNTYAAYRHETNTEKYDSGYYQASVEAVEYFMDPRNFFNETDIFQFFDLSAVANVAEDAVKPVLAGTFMENAVLENGMTYAQYFCKLGEQLGVNPVYLAAKARQEQGVAGTSPIISGQCGSKLWDFYRDQTQQTESGNQVSPPPSGYDEEKLLALNGYYNFYNVKAGGTGLFQIYYNAMQRAIIGTESMANTWGGNPSWDTKWKSIYGGAYVLKEDYIDRYQSTIYLQKFNVDSRSGRNFWGQYMQAVSGAMTEARSLYHSFASIDALDLSYTFLIPVYEGMPDTPCADPANGSCSLLAQSNTKYSYQVELTQPLRRSAASSSVYLEQEVYSGATLALNGIITHSYGIRELQYSWDMEEWQTVSCGNQLNFSPTVDFSENSSHILIIRGKAAYDNKDNAKKSNAYFLCAVIYVKVVSPPKVELSFQVGNMQTTRTVSAGKTITLPESNASDFAGWLGSDGSFLPSGAQVVLSSDVTYSAIFLKLQTLDGAALSTTESAPYLRFSAIADSKAYQKLISHSQNSISFSVVFSSDKGQYQCQNIQLQSVMTNAGEWLQLNAHTDTLTSSEYRTEYSAVFYAHLQYTNDETKTLVFYGEAFARSAVQVAAAAIADTSANYSPETVDFLESIVNHS